MKNILMFLLCCVLLTCCSTRTNIISNPLGDGYYADPSIVHYEGTDYICATIAPWGGEEPGVLVSGDFIHWER